MLTITMEQIEKITVQLLRLLEGNLISHVNNVVFNESNYIEKSNLIDTYHDAVETSLQHGFVLHDDITSFVVISFLYHKQTIPILTTSNLVILRNSSLTNEEKLYLVHKNLLKDGN